MINLTEYKRDYKATTASGCKLDPTLDANNETWYRCVHHRTFQSYRERWWFIALDNCDTQKGLYLKYRITMTNSQTNQWLRHFSADEFCKAKPAHSGSLILTDFSTQTSSTPIFLCAFSSTYFLWQVHLKLVSRKLMLNYLYWNIFFRCFIHSSFASQNIQTLHCISFIRYYLNVQY